MTDRRVRQLAENEARARTENERRQPWLHSHPRVSFVCECFDDSCQSLIGLSRAQYETARENARRFVIAPGHDEPTIERVVSRQDGYWLVEKTEPEAIEVAEATAPDHDDPS